MRFFATLFIASLALASVASAQPAKEEKHKSAKGAKEYFVNGKSIPGVPFPVSDSYAGLLPISSKKKESRELFFWWYPSESEIGKDDLTIWMNGGPGCSSLEGLLQENGPWLVPWNRHDVVKNPYSWTKLSNVLWVEQPVGVGLGKGEPNISNEKELGAEFYGFLVQFFNTFPELKNKRLWLTGESYAGKYIPYIANEILSHHSSRENKKNGINYQGFAINDPSFASDLASEELASVEFATHFQKTLGLNDTVIRKLQQKAADNGVQDFMSKNLKYPPSGPIQVPSQLSPTYDAFEDFVTAATEVNPCFNIYNIQDKCPSFYDPLGFAPDALEPSANNFVNNQTGFKKYIHADPEQVWYECVNGVFTGRGDTSAAPADNKVLQRVIEKGPAKRNVIQHGEVDAVLIANGSALAIQNTTWNGKQGFQNPPKQQLIVEGKRAGVVQSERGLTFARIDGSGHMIPQDKPAVAYKLQQFLLGQISAQDLSL